MVSLGTPVHTEESDTSELQSTYNKSGAQQVEHLYKVLVVGDLGVGKTSVVQRYCSNNFSSNYKATIGVDFTTKRIQWDAYTSVSLQLWDIAGQERFGHITRNYYKYAIAAILVFDLSKSSTFVAVEKWLKDIHSKVMLADDKPIPILLLANKCDIPNVEVDDNLIEEFCQHHNIFTWLHTSAKNNINIEEAMMTLVERIIALNTKAQQQSDANLLVQLEMSQKTDSRRKSNCCKI